MRAVYRHARRRLRVALFVVTHRRGNPLAGVVSGLFSKKNARRNGLRHHHRTALFWPSTVRSGEWPTWFSFWFSGCRRALAKGQRHGVDGFYCAILLLLPHRPLSNRPGQRRRAAERTHRHLLVCARRVMMIGRHGIVADSSPQ